MSILSIKLDQLVPDPANARRITDGEVADLAASIQAVGLLQPIVVRPLVNDSPGDGWMVVAGNRRVAACRSLGRTHIAAVEYCRDGVHASPDDSLALAASAAENMVRAPMHPVDTWRAIKAMQDEGWQPDDAAAALGLAPRYARRLAHLGGLSPALLDLMAADPELPAGPYLRTIAAAPREVQEKSLKEARRQDGDKFLSWSTIARLCDRTRIPQSRAIFIPALLDWDEDLFAAPGSEDQFTTADVAQFMVLQSRALAERAAASKGRMIVSVYTDKGDIKPPAGYRLTWDQVPKRWKKDDPRKVVAAITPSGWRQGDVMERVIVPIPKPEERGEAPVESTPAPRAREPITKATQARLAALKGEATRAALGSFGCSGDLEQAVKLLVLCFGADNVAIDNGQQAYARQRVVQPHVAKLLREDGTLRALAPDELTAIAADIAAAIVSFDQPMTSFGTSGDVAEWIGRAVGAEQNMPRCDTEDVLRGFATEKLVEIAEAHGIATHGRRKDLLARMVGNLPDWRPVSFGAPGLSLETMSDDDFDATVEASAEEVIEDAAIEADDDDPRYAPPPAKPRRARRSAPPQETAP